jgi:hypothetical protein
MATVKAFRNDCFPILEDYLMLRRPLERGRCSSPLLSNSENSPRLPRPRVSTLATLPNLLLSLTGAVAVGIL